MANRLAIKHPGRYAGIAAFISNINSNLGADEECPTPAEPIPILTVSGKRDRTTPFDGGGADVWGEELLSAEATRDFWVDNNVQDDPPSPQPVEYTEALSTVFCTRTPAPDTGADVQLCTFEGDTKSLRSPRSTSNRRVWPGAFSETAGRCSGGSPGGVEHRPARKETHGRRQECAGGGTRTHTGHKSQRILSPLRLPLPPPRHFGLQRRQGPNLGSARQFGWTRFTGLLPRSAINPAL